MTRTLRAPHALTVEQFKDDTWGASFKIDSRLLAPVLLELALIRESLADRLICLGENGVKVSLHLTRDNEFSSGHYEKSTADIMLSQRDLEFLSSFLLKYYRDRVAEVDHIDIDIYRPDSGVEEGVFIIQAADSNPGMSGDEARRILGIT